jgi:transposase
MTPVLGYDMRCHNLSHCTASFHTTIIAFCWLFVGMVLRVFARRAWRSARSYASDVDSYDDKRTERSCWTDGAYAGNEPQSAPAPTGRTLEIAQSPDSANGFVVIARRWFVERPFTRISRNRRLTRDFERYCHQCRRLFPARHDPPQAQTVHKARPLIMNPLFLYRR